MSEPIDPPDPYPIVRVTEPVDRIKQLAERLKSANPFESERLARELLEEARSIPPFPDVWRCRTCRWWAMSVESQRLGDCRKASSGSPPFSGSMRVGSREEWQKSPPFLETDEDFGCIQWQARDGE